MHNKLYEEWITQNVKDPYGKCDHYTDLMREEFPELIKVRGHYYCVGWGERAHWWLKASDGTIVDPTKDQFPSRGKGVYIEHDENSPEPTGMCADCGSYCYDGEYFCSEACKNSTMSYLYSNRF